MLEGVENINSCTELIRNLHGLEGFRPESKSSPNKGHIRSASHGQTASSTTGHLKPSLVKNRPNNLNVLGAIHGHQRAFSHGQIDSSTAIKKIGHHRIGSKTDFILPPGHRDTNSAGSISKLSSRFNSGFFSGHSRQASRTESIYTLRQTIIPSPNFWFGFLLHFFQQKPVSKNITDFGVSEPYSIIIPNHIIYQQEQQQQLEQQQQQQEEEKQKKNKHQSQKHKQLLNTNRISTTKYTFLSFLPKNLLEQFHRIANLYFLFIVLLNWYPAINAFGKEIAILPIGFVLGVTAIKDLFEDRRRHQSDKRINNTLCRVYNSQIGRYKKVPWKNITVGDIVHLSNNEVVPADILLLRSSDVNGYCYIDTGHLDGEMNLKARQVVRCLINKQGIFDPKMFTYKIEIDPPTTKIYRFHGVLIHSSGRKIPISTENLILRESIIKNTNFVEGIVLYAGHETKALLNNGGPRYKCSQLEKQMNRDVFWCLVILIVLCLIGAIGFSFYSPTQDSILSFSTFLTFLTFVIIFQIMIPLSLYVTLETCKMLQVYHIHNDVEMFDSELNKRVECRALNITEELGQIQYIFSDKTGTLTENKMIFRSCTIAGNEYYQPDTKINVKLQTDLFASDLKKKIFEFLIMMSICNTVVVFKHPHRDSIRASDFVDSPLTQTINNETNFLEDLNDETRSRSPSPKLKQRKPFLSPIISCSVSPTNYTIAINKKFSDFSNLFSEKCRGIYRRTTKLYDKQSKMSTLLSKNLDFKPIYEAESPDELALVQTALNYGFKLIKRNHNLVRISLPGQGAIDYKVLQVLPFDSNRKCMSIVVLEPNSHEIVLYCKGADSTILNRLDKSSFDVNKKRIHERIKSQIALNANKGLRVLVFAKKIIPQWEFVEWIQRHKEIAMKSQRNHENLMTESYLKLESNLELLGATGIEDRLQDGVPETLATLIDAGIIIWVLTGDKPETAINIAYSAKLFSSEMQLLQLMCCNSRQVAENLIRQYLEEINTNDLCHSPQKKRTRLSFKDIFSHKFDRFFAKTRRKYSKMYTHKSNKALVVDGKTLTIILDKKSNLTRPFLELTKYCRSVLCCRATPLQKAYIVKVVKEELKMRTLAIGDGANDVSMLQTADVGVGISGQEGMQAVMASDFALSRFRYLKRLLLVHGHWSYERLVRMVLYFFYKNAAFVFLVFWFQFYCQFSGTVMIDQIYLMFYNLLFTSLPPLSIGVYDQDAPESLLISKPYLYSQGRLGKIYKSRLFWLTIVDAFYQSIAIFFTAKAAYFDTDCGIWEFGNTVLSACMIVMSLHVAIETRSWTIIHLLSLVASILFFYLFLFIYNSICIFMSYMDTYWIIQRQFLSLTYWLVIILSSIIALIPRLLIKVTNTVFCPDDVTIELLTHRKSFKKRYILILRYIYFVNVKNKLKLYNNRKVIYKK